MKQKFELLLVLNFFYFKFVFNFDLENLKIIFLNYSYLTKMTILNYNGTRYNFNVRFIHKRLLKQCYSHIEIVAGPVISAQQSK